MKIIQMLTTLAFGDAVGNNAFAIRDILADNGFDTEIIAENIDKRLPRGVAKQMSDRFRLQEDDIVIYHASTGTKLNFDLPKFGGRKMMVYHNITPPHFFRGYSSEAERLTEYGYEGLRFLVDKVSYCIADSDFNRQDLIGMGYKCPIDVCPIVVPFEDYKKKPDVQVLAQYRDDGYTNLLFVGRIAPNKRQEDLIRAFFYYKRYYNPNSRLFLVGSASGMERYDSCLKAYAERLGIEDKVVFTGHISFNSILAYYRLADVFVCMSEHEGFCVPLVEAMYFDTPIVAYRSSAIPDTMGEGGLLLEDKDPHMAAAVIDRVVRDEALRAYISTRQRAKLMEYSYDAVKARLVGYIEKFLRQ